MSLIIFLINENYILLHTQIYNNRCCLLFTSFFYLDTLFDDITDRIQRNISFLCFLFYIYIC